MERTLVIIKPDGVKRKLIGKIISYYEEKNLDIKALKMVQATREMLEDHYFEHKGRPYFNELIDYMLEGSVCIMIVEGNKVIEMVRKINGSTNPANADLASIRGKFCDDISRNLVHSSDSPESAEREISVWFSDKYNRSLVMS